MPDLYAVPERYTPNAPMLRQTLKGSIWRFTLDHTGNQDEKYWLVAGVYDKRDLNWLGCIGYIQRPRQTGQTRLHKATSQTLLRSGRQGLRNTTLRIDQLEQAGQFFTDLHADLAFNWSTLGRDADFQQLIFRICSLEALRLAAATTPYRVVAGEQMGKSPVRYQDGKINPMATAATLLKVPDLLEKQIAFDQITYGSMQRRAVVCEAVIQYELMLMHQLMEAILSLNVELIGETFKSCLPQLAARNFLWASLCLDPMQHDRSLKTVAGLLQARAIVATELALYELDETLSILREHKSWLSPRVARLLRLPFSREHLPACYESLLGLLDDSLTKLVEGAAHQSRHQHNVAIDEVKALLRNRFGIGGRDTPWRYWEEFDRNHRRFFCTSVLPIHIQ